MSALDIIRRRSQLAEGFVAPRSGDVAVAAAGLERMRRLVDALGNPQRAYKTIHVAGSKGKGSTVAYAAAILTATGRKTGRYTSPHLMDWRERITVDGVDISQADFGRVIAYVDETMTRLEAVRPDDPPHYAFELLTAAAFVHFAQVGCDAAVIEVGIGGRFDSTNVVDADVAVITSIEAEHLDILGPTLADVAWNKAGVMRQGRPSVTVTQDPVVMTVLVDESDDLSSYVHREGQEWSVVGSAEAFNVTTPRATYAALSISTPVPSQITNAGAAVVATTLIGYHHGRWRRPPPSRFQVQIGLTNGKLPGRFEVLDHGGLVVLDVAHTPVSLTALGEGIRSAFAGRRIAIVLGLLMDKALEDVAASVARWADVAVASSVPSPRGRPADRVARALLIANLDARVVSDPKAALGEARRLIGTDGVIVVTGSFTLVAHIRLLLLPPPRVKPA